MPKPYSYDLRQKVMQAIEMDGLKKNEASQLFGISRNTINLWFERREETGDITVKARASSSQKPKISDWEKFREFVKEHEDKTQAEMADPKTPKPQHQILIRRTSCGCFSSPPS